MKQRAALFSIFILIENTGAALFSALQGMLAAICAIVLFRSHNALILNGGQGRD